LYLAAAASTVRQAIGAPLTPSEAEQLDDGLLPARTALGDEVEAVWAEGLAMSLSQAIELAIDLSCPEA